MMNPETRRTRLRSIHSKSALFSRRQAYKHRIIWGWLVLVITVLSSPLEATSENFLSRSDREIFDAIYDVPPQRQPLGTAMEVVTEFGDPKTMMGLSILLMAYGDDDPRETGRLLSSAFIGGGLVVLGMKQIVQRKRPLEDELGDPSFPSGHTSIAFSMATVLGYQYPKWRIPLYIGAGLVGLSRIYLGRHYASDVLMGAAVGTISGTVVWRNRITLLSWEF
jgi:undecaprenyl-diphosphatase